jgi:hypothetical protein
MEEDEDSIKKGIEEGVIDSEEGGETMEAELNEAIESDDDTK